MEDYLRSNYRKKKVLVTGNTGFKGCWLTLWLKELDAEVVGYALAPETTPAMYHDLELQLDVRQYFADVRSLNEVVKCIENEKPDIIFHLAAQSLVGESYDCPSETIAINAMGTVNILEAVRRLSLPTNVIVITTDKCYENKEWVFSYRENDPLGGYDPYSASKSAAEILTASYRRSFFHPHNYKQHKTKVATVRAGNVIGGGDWADRRIVPDCIRALSRNKTIHVRNPSATRPWQHVLEPIGGYLLLGAKMLNPGNMALDRLCDAFNFGPLILSNKSVRQVVEEMICQWGRGEWKHDSGKANHEASLLNLTIDRAYHVLDWRPQWNFKMTIAKTVEWYKASIENNDTALLRKLSMRQIEEYSSGFRLKN